MSDAFKPAPPAIVRPGPSLGSEAVKAQALRPGCVNPNRTTLWSFAAGILVPLEIPRTRFRSADEERGTETHQGERA